MVKRLHIATDSVVISRAGYSAGPSTPEVGKAFDSSWPFTGLVVGRGTYSDTSPIAPPGANRTTSNAPMLITAGNLRTSYSRFLVIFFFADGNRQRPTVMRATYSNSTTLAVARVRWDQYWERLMDPVPYVAFAA